MSLTVDELRRAQALLEQFGFTVLEPECPDCHDSGKVTIDLPGLYRVVECSHAARWKQLEVLIAREQQRATGAMRGPSFALPGDRRAGAPST